MSDHVITQLIWAVVLASIAGAVVWLVKREQDERAGAWRKKIELQLDGVQREIEQFGVWKLQQAKYAAEAEHDAISKLEAIERRMLDRLAELTARVTSNEHRFDNVIANTEASRHEFATFKDKTEKAVVNTHAALDAAVAEVKTYATAAAKLGSQPASLGMPRFRP